MHDVLADNLRHIFRLHKSVPDPLWIDHNRRPMLALIQTAGLVRAHRSLQPGSADRILEKLLQLVLAVR